MIDDADCDRMCDILLMMMANMMVCTMDMFGMLMQIEVFGSSSSSSFGADDECGSFADFSRRV